MYQNKPIIGIAGGIASGKSHVARLFGDMGCMVISSDALVRTAYTHPTVKRAVMEMFGEDVFTPGGKVDRAAIGQAVFGDVAKRQELEKLLHPIVNQVRLQRMQAGGDDPTVWAFVWDSPLLFETGLHKLCTAVVFVEAPQALRVARASAQRGWDEKELLRRENVQWPLDKKRSNADYVISNASGSANGSPGGSVCPPEPQPDAESGVATDATRTCGLPNDDAPVSTSCQCSGNRSSSKPELKHPDAARMSSTSSTPDLGDRDTATPLNDQVRMVLDLILGSGGCEKAAANGGCGQACRCVAPG